MTLSVLILAKNEEKNIKDAIESAKFADETIVVDDFSTDNTKKIAESLGAKVYQRALNGNFGAQKTFAIEQSTSEWIFILDADERITSELAAEIKEIIIKGEYFAYKVPHRNYIMGQEIRYGGWYPDYGTRLLPRAGVSVEGIVHESATHRYKEKKLKYPVTHYTYNSWEQYLHKFNLYTKMAAEKNYQKGKRTAFFKDIVLRPCFTFFKMYVLRAGWRDGKLGFIMAVLNYFYTMMKYIKLYYLQNEIKNNEMLDFDNHQNN
ncbi:MAG: glycosyltransferase family 2 protein [Sporomusaceae bacterium]|nr:glycosyltransferase family 2 protein [Sporomusaceae bacterium]